MKNPLKKSNIVALSAAFFLSCATIDADIKKNDDGWNFSLPKTNHHHIVEMISKASALRFIACAMGVIGLILIKQSINQTTRDCNCPDAKKSSPHVTLLPIIAGTVFTGASICAILYDHKILGCFVKAR